MKLKVKVLAAVVCAFALCAALAGCGGGSENDYNANFQGDWMLSGGASEGQDLDAESISAMEQMGLYVYIQLKEGGSATISMFGNNMEGTWEAKDATTVALTIQGDTEDATLDGDELVLAVDNDALRFKRGEIPSAAISGQSGSSDEQSSAQGADAEVSQSGSQSADTDSEQSGDSGDSEQDEEQSDGEDEGSES